MGCDRSSLLWLQMSVVISSMFIADLVINLYLTKTFVVYIHVVQLQFLALFILLCEMLDITTTAYMILQILQYIYH